MRVLYVVVVTVVLWGCDAGGINTPSDPTPGSSVSPSTVPADLQTPGSIGGVTATGGTYCHEVPDPPPGPIMARIVPRQPLGGATTQGLECHEDPPGGGGPVPDPSDGGPGGGAPVPPMEDDDGQDVNKIVPDCSKPQSDARVKAYCDGWAPTGSDLVAIQQSLSRLRSRGSVCASLANAAEALINQGHFRIYQLTNQSFGGAAPRSGDWAIIADVWIKYWQTNTSPQGANLDSSIAHEMDHHVGNDRVAGTTDSHGHLIINGTVNKYHTVNSWTCGGNPGNAQ